MFTPGVFDLHPSSFSFDYLFIYLKHTQLGGAEQLVVNAALALQSKGYDILIFTAHHDPSHCFDEVKPTGGLGKRVHCHGNWIPASILGKAFALCAVLRMYWISLIIFSFYSPNIIFLDQVSAVCPLLKFTNAKVNSQNHVK